MDYNRDDVKCVHEGQANEQLIEQLRKFKDYLLSEDVPEWQQLIATAGFVTDVLKTLKWSKHKKIFSKYLDNDEDNSSIICDEMCVEVTAAVNHYFSLPYADELNGMWQDWYFNDTGKYADIKTISDMCGIITDRIEQKYPDLLEWEKKYFKYEED